MPGVADGDYGTFAAMELHLLEELTTVFGISILVLTLCHRVGIPAIAGFLFTGILAGPHGFGLVSSAKSIDLMAEIGVVLLLFTIGAEFSMQRLLQIRRWIFVAGIIQLCLTVGLTMAVALLVGIAPKDALFLGVLVSLSSTAVVLKVLQDRAEMDSVHGRATFSILIFQDLAVIPMMILLPLLSSGAPFSFSALGFLMAKALAVLLIVWVGAHWIVPRVLHLVVATKNRELFLLAVVAICFSVAFFTHAAGLSLALGALLAGLVISESEFSHQAVGNVIPFQQLFTTLFFVSIGMLIDPAFVGREFALVLFGTLTVIVLKFCGAFPAIAALGLSRRAAFLGAVCLAQVGEFSFVLAREALRLNVISSDLFQGFLTISVVTIGLTPILIRLGPKLSKMLQDRPLRNVLDTEKHLFAHEPLVGHALVIGYGVNGEAVSEALELAHITYSAVEMNPQIVRAARARGRKVAFGDATNESVLREEGVASAKVVFIAISDPVATRRIVDLVRRANPSAYLIVRTRLVEEVKELQKLGAHEVIADEFETAVEGLCRVLRRFLIPNVEIEKYAGAFRQAGYEMIRTHAPAPAGLKDLHSLVPEVDLISLRVEPSSRYVGKSLAEVSLRATHGVTLLAVKRSEAAGGEVKINPDGTAVLQANDIALILGPVKDLLQLEECFRG